jgi:serine/threonine protein kinase
MKDIKNLTRISKCKFGKFKIVNKIYKKVYTIVFNSLKSENEKENKPRILKKVGENEYSLVCKFLKNSKISKNKKIGGCKGVESKKIIDIVYSDQVDAKEKKYKRYIPFHWLVEPKTQTNVEILKMSPFLNEVCQNEILKKFANFYNDYYCVFDTAWKSRRQGNICMEYSGKPLSLFAEEMSEEEVKCVVFQVLLGLCWAQHDVHMKHHDLHTENVFLQILDLEENEQGKIVTFPIMTKESTNPFSLFKKHEEELLTYKIPQKYKVKIADFGLSSCTNPKTKRRHERADFHLLEDDNTKKWGKFNGTLYENEGYDILCFLYGFMDDTNSIGRAYIKTVINKINDLAGHKIKVSKYNRPMESCNVNPYDLLSSDLFLDWKVNKQ